MVQLANTVDWQQRGTAKFLTLSEATCWRWKDRLRDGTQVLELTVWLTQGGEGRQERHHWVSCLERRMAGVAEEEAALAECGVDVKTRSNRVGEKAKE